MTRESNTANSLKGDATNTAQGNELITCSIINLLTDDTIKFKLIPDELSESVSGNFDPQDIPGRFAPFIGYSNTGARTFSFSVTLHEDYCDGGVYETVCKLKALEYPNYQGSIVISPKCYVHFGDMIKTYAICDQVSVNWSKPIVTSHSGKKTFVQADVDLSFQEFVKSGRITSSSMSSGGFSASY